MDDTTRRTYRRSSVFWYDLAICILFLLWAANGVRERAVPPVAVGIPMSGFFALMTYLGSRRSAARGDGRRFVRRISRRWSP